MSKAAANGIKTARNPKVFLIDSDINRVQEMAKVLKSEGFDAIAYNTPRGLLGHMRRELPDAVIMEVILPTKSGFEIAAQMQADQRLSKIPIFFTTDIQDSDDLHEDYFSRPLNLQRLIQAIRKRIEN
jgi:two-component system sensor histidine kinase/response regulator